MVVLKFTLTPEAASKIHDLLVCLGKFSETVAIEARRDRVGLRSPPSYFPHLTPCLSSHLLLSILPNQLTLLLHLMESNSSQAMNASPVMAGQTAALRVACTPKHSCLYSKDGCTTHLAATGP